MALFQFSTSINTTISELAEKLTSWQEDGASISDIAISNVNDITLLINDKYCNITYNMSLSSNANYYWFLCDSLGYETLIILCDSPNVNENGYHTTLGSALFNAIYFLYNGKLVRNPQVDEPICSQFNIPNGLIIDSDNNKNVLLTKCTFVNKALTTNVGETELSDTLYLSTNLSSAGFLAKVISLEKEFVNIGRFFYLPNNNIVRGLSHYKKRTILKNAEIELWTECYNDNEKIYDRKEENIFYKNIHNNIKMVPDGNIEMGYIQLPSGDSLYLKSDTPFFFNKTIYIVAYNENSFIHYNVGSLRSAHSNNIIACGEEIYFKNNKFPLYFPRCFSLNTVDKPIFGTSQYSGYEKNGYLLLSWKNKTFAGDADTQLASRLNQYILDYYNNENGEYYYDFGNNAAMSMTWKIMKMVPKKYIYVIKTPLREEYPYTAYINKNKIISSESFFLNEDEVNSFTHSSNYLLKSYYLIIGGNQYHTLGTSNPGSNDNKGKQIKTPELKIDYFGIVEESQSDEEIQKNIQYLAKKFNVDLND